METEQETFSEHILHHVNPDPKMMSTFPGVIFHSTAARQQGKDITIPKITVQHSTLTLGLLDKITVDYMIKNT